MPEPDPVGKMQLFFFYLIRDADSYDLMVQVEVEQSDGRSVILFLQAVRMKPDQFLPTCEIQRPRLLTVCTLEIE